LIKRAQFIGVLAFSLGYVTSSAGYAGEWEVPGWLYEIKFGVLHHDTGSLWSGFRRESGVDINLEAIFSPHAKLLGGAIRPAFGGSANIAGDTSKLYTGFRWQYEHLNGMFVGIGLGGAIHNGKLKPQQNDRKALGSRVLFHIPIEIGYRFGASSALSVYFDHVSNANLADANEGMDTLGLRYGYRF
jgi:lipid A 3-O-deacylase